MKNKVFYSICLGFVLGILLASFSLLNFFVLSLLGVVSVGILIFFFFVSKNRWGIVFSVFILSISLGAFRFGLSATSPLNELRVGENIILTGEVVAAPDFRESSQKLTIKLEDKTKILVTVNFNETYRYGDELEITGVLKRPENFITDQGKKFDYINYLRKDGIFYLMNYPKIVVLSSGNGNKLKSVLFSAKDRFLEKINFVVPNPESLLLGGLILGEKSAFSQELTNDFVKTGTIHIVALSGYNITIISEWFMKLFRFLPFGLGIFGGMLSILFFVLMTGAGSTALRAGTMAMIVLVARYTGRTYEVGRALIIAGVFMILMNPLVLVYDISFQLSFLATLALIFFTPKVEKYFEFATERFQLREMVSVTFAVYVFVLPFILYKMGNFSLVALPANILILPFIPLTMLLGFLTAFSGMVWYIFSVPFGLLSSLLLRYELTVINFFADIPNSSFTVPDFPVIFVILIYAYFIYVLFGEDIKKYFIEPF